VFDRGEQPDLALVASPAVMLPMLGLAVLALIPVAVRQWRKRSGR
jgi:hypothetical protein